jgi:hypothetical protein
MRNTESFFAALRTPVALDCTGLSPHPPEIKVVGIWHFFYDFCTMSDKAAVHKVLKGIKAVRFLKGRSASTHPLTEKKNGARIHSWRKTDKAEKDSCFPIKSKKAF